MTTHSRRLSCLLILLLAILFCVSYANADTLTTREDFIRAIEEHTELGDTEYKLTLSPSLLTDVKTGMDDWVSEARANCGMRSFTYSFNEYLGTLSLSNIEYRVAVRILQAYRNGRTQLLTSREKQTLDQALSIISNAPDEELDREQYLHDYLCSTIKYFTDDEAYAEKDQAIGALLNGKADCDGYSEAFYLLCNLAGIPARFQHGDTFEKTDNSEVTHMWNLVSVYDTWLMVDVTWDDSDEDKGNFYLYYNIGSERASETHTWNASLLTVPWAAKSSNAFRPVSVVEGYTNSISAAENYIRDTLINLKPNRIALRYANDINLNDDDERLGKWVYSTGVKGYIWKTGGHCLEILVTEWYDEYRIVSNDQEALAYVQEMKASGKNSFHIFFAGDYGQCLFANDMAGYYNLEGQFGFGRDEMFYSTDSQRVSFSDVLFDKYFRVCPNENAVLDYIAELSRNHINEFTICIPGEYGESLLQNKLASYYLLEGKLGFESSDMTYYSKTHRFIYKNVIYAEHFQVCNSGSEVVSFIDNAARYAYSTLQLHVPGNYGASLFANKAALMSDLLDETLLKNGFKMTYYQSSQVCIIKNAEYWPKKNRASLNSLDSFMRELLISQPQSVAVWTDGTYQWNDSRISDLCTSLYRQGVESFRYFTSSSRIEFVNLSYVSNYCLVNSEDELMSYLRQCRSRSQYSFRVYCTKSLYQSLSANRFERFFDLTSSILQRGQSISYQNDYYLISMDAVKYKK